MQKMNLELRRLQTCLEEAHAVVVAAAAAARAEAHAAVTTTAVATDAAAAVTEGPMVGCFQRSVGEDADSDGAAAGAARLVRRHVGGRVLRVVEPSPPVAARSSSTTTPLGVCIGSSPSN
jgi:hypothetical protein